MPLVALTRRTSRPESADMTLEKNNRTNYRRDCTYCWKDPAHVRILLSPLSDTHTHTQSGDLSYKSCLTTCTRVRGKYFAAGVPLHHISTPSKPLWAFGNESRATSIQREFAKHSFRENSLCSLLLQEGFFRHSDGDDPFIDQHASWKQMSLTLVGIPWNVIAHNNCHSSLSKNL